MPQKLMDVSRIREVGWKYKTELEDGLKITYKWYLDNYVLINGGNMDE